MLLTGVQNLQREKWDWVLPDGLLREAYASHYLDLDEALAWVKALDFDTKNGEAPPEPASK
jgi:ATP-dependent Lhr-like helicase